MFDRIFYNLERFEDGEWIDLFGGYDKTEVKAWSEVCRRKEPGQYRITEEAESYAVLLQDISAIRVSNLPTDTEVVILSEKFFLEYASTLESYTVKHLVVNVNGIIPEHADSAYLLTQVEGPTKDGKEFRWEHLTLCATEADADDYIAKLMDSDEGWEADDNGIYKKRLGCHIYKRSVKVLP